MTDDPAGTPINSGSTTTSESGGSTLRLVNALLRRRRAILGCAVATAALAVGGTLLTSPPAARVVATFRAPTSVAVVMSELAAREARQGLAAGDSEGAPVPTVRVSRVAEPDLWRIAVTSEDVERSRETARRFLEAGRGVPVADEPDWLDEVWTALRDAETELRRFVDENPDYEDSPSIRVEFDRLARRVELRHAIAVDAERNALLRRINADPSAEAVDEMVVVAPPAVESSDRILYPAALGLVIGALLGVLWVFAREQATGFARRDPEAYREFRELMGRARRDLSRPWEIFRRSR